MGRSGNNVADDMRLVLDVEVVRVGKEVEVEAVEHTLRVKGALISQNDSPRIERQYGHHAL